ncbi:MAG: UDP-glucose/GDP-mannose dehydrogenase family protein [Aurantimicrobium sp.]|uniref:UDP-glucose dehydrogenase family protein n=1 Tax=Aurantimicrobium sp. TaxID=1930784 RepID=UPI00303B8005
MAYEERIVMPQVTVIGTGYVGLVTGSCLAEMGNEVFCLDVDENKIASLRAGHIPIYEPGLEEIVVKNVSSGNLNFTTDSHQAIEHGEFLFIAVGTPPLEDGSADLTYVLEVAKQIGMNRSTDCVVIDKSTVPVGTADKVKSVIDAELSQRGLSINISVVSNPEFLKEGSAVDDFFAPDRVVIGTSDSGAEKQMRKLYQPFIAQGSPFIVMSAKSAELTKYAANAMLATRISFMNELANLAAEIGADISDVEQGIGTDARIGKSFLRAGVGFGGSCFPKDIKALKATASETHGATSFILEAVEKVNVLQQHSLASRVHKRLGDLAGKKVAIWGLAFKPHTDDMREATSLAVIPDLLKLGAEVVAYDPIATETAQKALSGFTVGYVGDKYEAVKGADVLVILTEWPEFASPDYELLKKELSNSIIFDGRNILDRSVVASTGFEYHSVGRAAIV